MKEYVNKQLEEQIGKMIDDLAHGNLEQIERTFDVVQNFILHDETVFINGVKKKKETREKEMVSIRDKFVKAVEKVLDHDTTDEKFASVIQAFKELQESEQVAMSKYFNDLVESVVSYKRKMDNDDKPLMKSPDGSKPVTDEDDIDKLLNKKE